MSDHLSLGVIGHVDHGKTSLVKALTGMDTDRLKEEKERGMSIVLGFAFLRTDAGMIDLIDVPGHENFVHTMIAGATSVNAALLAVDVREGVKPQTAEHLEITELIGVRRGVIALTKCDLAPGAERAEAVAKLRRALKGTYLDFAPIVFTSTRSGEGLGELQAELSSLLQGGPAPMVSPQFYLPVDRSFSIAGCGTVATGTLRLGCLRTGDEVELMPSGMRTLVRQLQFHHQAVHSLQPGQRAGVNLKGIKLQDLKRGDTLASPGLLHVSTLFDTHLSLLQAADSALLDGDPVRLLFGTTSVPARVRLLTGLALEPGQTSIVQLRTAQAVAAAVGEPFILRAGSPPTTIGGGRFLDPVARRHKRCDAAALARLQVLAGGSHEEVVAERLKAAGYAGMAVPALAAMLGASEIQLLSRLPDSIAVMIDDSTVLYRPFLDALGAMVDAAVIKFHKQFPTRAGAPLAYCRASLPRTVSDKVFQHVLNRLCSGKRMTVRAGLLCQFGYDPMAALSEPDRQWAATVETKVRQAGLAAPDMVELLDGEERREALLHLLVDQGSLLVLPAQDRQRRIVFHRDTVEDARRRLQQAYPPPTQFTVSDIRQLFGSTRKFIIPLLEYFDHVRYTRRHGEKRGMVENLVRR